MVKSGVVPSIPVQPIGYGDAEFFMRYHSTTFVFSLVVGVITCVCMICSQLDAHIAPGSWTGGLNVGYFIWQSDSNTKCVGVA